MAKLHSAKVLFEKIDALTSESLGTEGGESGIPNLMTQRDRQPRVAELHRRANVACHPRSCRTMALRKTADVHGLLESGQRA